MPILKLTIQGEADLGQIKSEAKKIEKTINKARSQTSSSSSSRASQIDEETDRLRELRKELRRKISLVDADLRLGNKSQKEAEESIRQIKQWAEAQEAFNREHLVGAQNLKTFANAQTRAQTGFKGMSAVTNRANQVLFDLNQGLQDLPFGMRGVGNNIPFVIEGFRRFGKAAKEQGVSPLRTFGRALTSPAGLIGTAAAVIPTLILFADQFDLFGSSASKAKEQVSGVVSNLTSLQNKINDLRGIDSLFNIEEDLETVRTLAVFEEDIRDKQREILDDAAFRGTIAEALGGRGKALLSTEQLDEFNRLQELLEQTEKQRLDLETKIRVAKDAQATQTVQERKEQKEILELQKQIEDSHRDVLKLRKQALEFSVETPDPLDPLAGRGEQAMKDATQARLNEINRIVSKRKEAAQQIKDIKRDEVRTRVQLEQQALSTISALAQAIAPRNKALALSLIAIEKGIRIAQVITSGIQKAASAEMQALLFSANPATAPLAAQAFAAAQAIRVRSAVAAGLIAAQGLAEGATALSRGGGGGGGSSGGEQRARNTNFDRQSRLPEFRGGGLRRTSHRDIDRVTGQPVVINVTQKSDAMGLAFEVRNGEAKIRSQQHSG